jgi:hypothetical protein
VLGREPAQNKRRNLVNKETPKQQPTLSTDSLIKTSKKGDIELTEKELGKVSGGNKKAKINEF